MGGTSSAVVIPMVKALDLGEGTGTVLTLESTLTDVFCIIGTVGVAVSLAAGVKPDATGLLGTAGFSLIAACLLGAGAGLFWSVLLTQAERLASTMLTTMAGALVVYGFCEQMGVSGAIATLTFGVTLGNLPRGVVLRVDRGAEAAPIKVKLREVKRVERAVYAEVVFLLKAAFFFYLGMKVDPSNFFSMAGVIAFILALVPFFPRYPSVRLLLGPSGASRRDALLATVLVPRGLAAAVLAQVPVQLFKKMVESLNPEAVQGLKEVARAGGAEFSIERYCSVAVGDVVATLPTGCDQFLVAERLGDVVAMMVFFSIAIVSLMVFLVERGALAAVGQFAFGAYTNVVDPQPDSPEPAPQTSHTPGS
jgi:NhaP-type Na+/H+ or K+/H+ antiporter